MSDIVVYTSITGGFNDRLSPPIADKKSLKNVDFVCFSDNPSQITPPWNVLRPRWEHPTSSRRTSRYHKLNPHRLFPNVKYSIWIDGSEQLLAQPRALIKKYLGKADFATFAHPQRTKVSEEVRACIRLKKDDPDVLIEHGKRYQQHLHFDDTSGLFETAMVLRRHTPEVAAFNELWWAELFNGSLRDQVSLPFAIHQTGLKVGIVEGRRGGCQHLRHTPHK